LYTYGTISSAILTANFPILVPPYFCTSHVASGSTLFCRFEGVVGGEYDNEEDLEDKGDGGVDDILDKNLIGVPGLTWLPTCLIAFPTSVIMS
jgi:hypothetical protein